ncbi:hypothetical protein EDB89DRAFT_2159248 [Lactarius sanguifluus]|nr:hypothetical protein EDB89DRAFT_2159248 [Lactarius sanguifluus]
MSITAKARTLVGPTPTPFTGDRAQAQHFLVEFLELDRQNRRHTLIICPALRVELVLSFIHGPLTDPWKRSVQRAHPEETADETLWDEFYDSFCTTWIDDPPALAQTTSSADPGPPLPPVIATTRSTPVPAQTTAASPLTPLVTPAAPRVEKRQHDDSDTEETRPSKCPRIATHAGPPRVRPLFVKLSVSPPRPVALRLRRMTSAPVLSIPPFLVQYSPPPRRPPSPPDDPVHAPPLVDPDPRPLAPDRTVVEGNNMLTGGVKTLEDSVFAPVSAQDDKVSNPHTGGSRPQTPCLTPDATDSPPQTPPRVYLFPRHAVERPHDPDELTTKTIDRQRRGNTRVPYPTTPRNHTGHARQTRSTAAPEDVPPTPVTSRHIRKRRRANAAAAPPHSPGTATTRSQPTTTPTDAPPTSAPLTSPPPNQTATCNHDRPVHTAHQHPDKPAQVEWQPDSQHPRRADTAETTHVTDRQRNRTNAAVELFLRRYDANRPMLRPTPTPPDRAYDAVARHRTFVLATNPDTTRITQPFALRPGPRTVLLRRKKK